MKIGILGSGDVGRVLGAGFVKKGHTVKLGTRNPGGEKVKSWAASVGAGASLGTFSEAAAFGDLVVVATLWSGTESALALAHPKNLEGKIVIDATNPLDFSVQPPRLALGHTTSAGEKIQALLPGAKVVKAFNAVGNPHMVDPSFPGGRPTMFIGGNDAGAKKTVMGLLTDFGWESVDLGGIETSRYLEPLAMIWILQYLRTSSGAHAFKLLKK
ncbi:MAG TPA: NADPH-dependent F420 reductase [Elusimicrobiota bacterium]|nr:NADPH-dependent F420 reductase [Elusimicrobiota bacterium]